MKRRITGYFCAALLAAVLLAGCADEKKAAESEKTQETAAEAEPEKTQETAAEAEPEETQETAAEAEPEETQETAAEAEPEETQRTAAAALEDGVYLAAFDTDSSMFHVSEACEGKGTLTVTDGQMTIHVSLSSKNIVNLYPGLAEDAQKEGAELLQPTLDTVTYSDGFTEEVNGFDVPVPVLDEEFDLALIGKKGTWYNHKVIVSDPVKAE